MANPTKILLYDLNEDIKAVLKDLLDSYAASLIPETTGTEKHISVRMEDLKKKLNATINEEGNFKESFVYNENGDVVTHTVTGDFNYIITYKYDTVVESATFGELKESEKVFQNADGKTVKVKKIYTTTAGDITGIETITSLVTV